MTISTATAPYLTATRAAWAAFRSELKQQRISRNRAVRQQARIAAMTDKELMHCAVQFGGAVTYPELRRRGLPVPGEISHS
jgi:hypothetical protein